MAIGTLEWNGAEMRALRETLLPAPRSGRATPLGLPWVNSRGWPSGKRTRWSAPSSLVVPYGQDFRDLGVDEALLRELSEMT